MKTITAIALAALIAMTAANAFAYQNHDPSGIGFVGDDTYDSAGSFQNHDPYGVRKIEEEIALSLAFVLPVV